MSEQVRRIDYFLEIIKKTAKIWSVLSTLFVLVFIIGYAFAEDGFSLKSIEILEFSLFPIGVVLGHILAWKREKWALVTVISLIAFYFLEFIIKGRLPRGPYFALVAAPGFLFFIYWVTNIRKAV